MSTTALLDHLETLTYPQFLAFLALYFNFGDKCQVDLLRDFLFTFPEFAHISAKNFPPSCLAPLQEKGLVAVYESYGSRRVWRCRRFSLEEHQRILSYLLQVDILSRFRTPQVAQRLYSCGLQNCDIVRGYYPNDFCLKFLNFQIELIQNQPSLAFCQQFFDNPPEKLKYPAMRLLGFLFWDQPCVPSNVPGYFNFLFYEAMLFSNSGDLLPLKEYIATIKSTKMPPKVPQWLLKEFIYPVQALLSLLALDPALFPNASSTGPTVYNHLRSVLRGSRAKTTLRSLLSTMTTYGWSSLYDFQHSAAFHLIVHILMAAVQYPELLNSSTSCFNLPTDSPERQLYRALILCSDNGSFSFPGLPLDMSKPSDNYLLRAVLDAVVYCLPPSMRPRLYTEAHAKALAAYGTRLAERGYRLPALFILTALQGTLAEDAPERTLLAELQSGGVTSPFAPGFFKDPTSLALSELTNALDNVLPKSAGEDASKGQPSEYRLSWQLCICPIHDYYAKKKAWAEEFYTPQCFHPFLQKRLKNGNWSVFKDARPLISKEALVLEALFPEPEAQLYQIFLNQQSDFSPLLCQVENLYCAITNGYYFTADIDRFLDRDSHPAKLRPGKPRLLVDKTKEGDWTLTADFPLNQIVDDSGRFSSQVLLRKTAENLWEYNDFTPAYGKFLKAMNHLGESTQDRHIQIRLPKECEAQLQKLLVPLAELFVLNGSGVTAQTESFRHEAGRIQLLLSIKVGSEEDSYDLEMKNRAWETPPTIVPIQSGDASLLLEDESGKFILDRDTGGELSAANAFKKAVPLLEEKAAGKFRWCLSSLEQLLELMEVLPTLENPPILEWQGMKPVSCGTLSMNFRTSSGLAWFDIGADVKIDEEQLLSLSQFLSLLPEKPSNFIQVGDGKFVRLTAQLRKTLSALRLGLPVKGAVRLGAAALPALEKSLPAENCQLLSPEITKNLSRIREVVETEPSLPQGLQCTLRDYQVLGYQWMSRLATLGIGCCLADDMGVGKTLQLLTLLLSRGAHGPSLVLAPASICRNWQLEAQKFIHGLVFTILGETSRQGAIAAAGPYDVIVVSYGLLGTCAKLLQSRTWNCLVLDEAQAIKNSASLRSQLVKGLQAKVRIAATGTPVENNIFEFWNLFDFLNPGMLGGHDHFQENWMTDGHAAPRLKLVTAPLILRRMKADVLAELPSKTEINLEVDFSRQERALYETLRREALETIANSGEGGGKAAMQILAQLTKLRRFCCHPTLATPTAGTLPEMGSKLSQLLELATELRASGHPALVFSQYVDMLAIVKQEFDKAGFSYCYLDGATPTKQRQKIVDAFQHGATDFFLISLKAGGLGLNLTAASYVILLDPWWNPAVENQAADRIYRIGQRNPVTIYRLYAKDTVEERVLELQAQKKELVNDLLSDQGGKKLSPEILMQLLQKE